VEEKLVPTCVTRLLGVEGRTRWRRGRMQGHDKVEEGGFMGQDKEEL
jgi:hypothetical protein